MANRHRKDCPSEEKIGLPEGRVGCVVNPGEIYAVPYWQEGLFCNYIFY